MKQRFSGRTVIVTGGTKGIGAAVVDIFLREGAQVVVVARGVEGGKALIERSGGAGARFVAGDIRDPKTSEEAIASALNWTGRLDVLVNNAARDYTSELLSTPVADVEDVLQVNFIGAFLMLQSAGRAMRQQGGGAIVNVTSRLAVIGVPSMVLYGASKGALLSLTRGAAVELAPYGIRVNAVAPGLTETPLLRAWLGGQSDPEGKRRDSLKGIPQGRFGKPEEVAALVAFLASEEADHITGVSVPVDGGYTAA